MVTKKNIELGTEWRLHGLVGKARPGGAPGSLSLSPSPGVQHLAEGEPRTAWWQSDLQMAITLWFLSSLLWKHDDL